MIVVGAKGFAKEVLEVLRNNNALDNLVFYDDISTDVPEKLYDRFKVLRSFEEVIDYFNKVEKKFTLGIGNPVARKKLYEKFSSVGGEYTSTISPHAVIGHFGNTIGAGCNIMTGSIITSDVVIKDGTIINLNCTIGHGCQVGAFVELSPGVHVSGNCIIGDYSALGTNATMLPKVKIGSNVIIGAGSVVNKDIPDNSMAVGVPAKIIKELPPLSF